MASITKYKTGYRAQVFVRGVRSSKIFRTKREAESWASGQETALQTPPTENKTLRDALKRYRDEVVPGKKGRRWDQVRINAFLECPYLPTESPLRSLTPDILGKWRDLRLQEVSAGTVLRDFGLLSSILETARREWRLLESNPVRDVRKPRQPDHRETVITWRQAVRMLRVMGYSRGPCKSATKAVCVAFMLAMRTGLRAGELCGLTWADVGDGFVRVAGHEGARKTQAAKREVPLIRQSRRLVESMRGWDSDSVFGLTAQTLDALFRRYRTRAGLSGFTFHDTRHTAATMLSGQVDVLTLCKIMGWSNTKQALIYYNPSVESIRQQLERRPPRK